MTNLISSTIVAGALFALGFDPHIHGEWHALWFVGVGALWALAAFGPRRGDR